VTASSPIVVAAPIASVTVQEDRAAVTRRGEVALGAGQHRLVIERVAPVLVDKTLTATATGARVLDVRCERAMAAWRDPAAGSTEAPAVLRAERTRLDAERQAAAGRVAVARAEIAAFVEVAAISLRDLSFAAARAASTATAAAQLAALDADDAAARVRRVVAEQELLELTAALARLDHRIAHAEAEAGAQAANLVIDLALDAPAEVALAIGYIVPGAAWRPYHRAVLTRGPGAPTVEWQTTACVWQATGEDWTAAELVFSLERPSLGVEPPVLTDDELAWRRRPDAVTVETREQEVQTTGLGAAPDGGQQVPGIDDGGLGLTLTAPRATIRADGAPHRVPAGGFTSTAELDRVAIPLRSSWVHLRAVLHNAGSAPLLAGPVDLVMASGYVGRTEIGFVAPGEQLAIGFGPDADVRVHRGETRDRDDAGLLGGWNVQTVRVVVRISNLGSERRDVVVTERIPVSELAQVEIQTSPADALRLGPADADVTQVVARAIDDRGLVTWAVELPPLARRAVTLEYRIKSQRGVAGV
jgi:uncharacterized protein (TIGR02231 family)